MSQTGGVDASGSEGATGIPVHSGAQPSSAPNDDTIPDLGQSALIAAVVAAGQSAGVSVVSDASSDLNNSSLRRKDASFMRKLSALKRTVAVTSQDGSHARVPPCAPVPEGAPLGAGRASVVIPKKSVNLGLEDTPLAALAANRRSSAQQSGLGIMSSRPGSRSSPVSPSTRLRASPMRGSRMHSPMERMQSPVVMGMDEGRRSRASTPLRASVMPTTLKGKDGEAVAEVLVVTQGEGGETAAGSKPSGPQSATSARARQRSAVVAYAMQVGAEITTEQADGPTKPATVPEHNVMHGGGDGHGGDAFAPAGHSNGAQRGQTSPTGAPNTIPAWPSVPASTSGSWDTQGKGLWACCCCILFLHQLHFVQTHMRIRGDCCRQSWLPLTAYASSCRNLNHQTAPALGMHASPRPLMDPAVGTFKK